MNEPNQKFFKLLFRQKPIGKTPKKKKKNYLQTLKNP